MGKALTVFVVLNLLATTAVVTLGTLSFLERKVLKTRTLELEATARTVSDNLRWGQDVAWETPEEKKPLAFSLSQPTSADGLDGLTNELKDLVRFATQREAQLSLRHDELVSTRATLADTRDTLATRERELTAARQEEAELTETLEDTRKQLADTRGNVATETRNKQSREQAISDKNEKLTELNNELASLEIDLETRVQEIALAQAEYDRCRLGGADEDSLNKKDVRGDKGTVMAVNSNWEYVVIDRGMMHDVQPEFEALVHRGKEYVGKLQVVRVEDTVAVAQIIPGSVVSEDGIRPGDKFFF